MQIHISNISNIFRKEKEVVSVIMSGLKLPLDDSQKEDEVMRAIIDHLKSFRSNLTVVFETEYVDRTYRDCYYTYYSTKLENYDRNCVRISFFENDITEDDNLDGLYAEKLQKAYLGFLILRPIVSACIGRNVISPRAKKNHKELAICETTVKATCMGYKLTVRGFPHSSQDGELMTCAETTIWSIMEYFGNKYSIYIPSLPSDIAGIIETLSFDRNIPSTGMPYDQISKVLQRQGLSCIVYDSENPRFQELFTCYVESGFPLAVCLRNDTGEIGHAIVCIGRKNISRNIINEAEAKEVYPKGTKYYFWNRAIKEFIFNDDNFPCYQSASFDEPVKHYPKSWKNVRISHFIVPLYKKIYIDAATAIDAANHLLSETIGAPNETIVRTFLTSNRSYKEYIAKNTDFSQEEKQLLISLNIAKFVWVTEYADKETFINNKANGIILMDATGHIDPKNISSIIFYQEGAYGYVYRQQVQKHFKYEYPLATQFTSFRNNLKNK